MRFCRFDDNRLGVVVGESVHDVTDALEVLPELRWPLPHGDHFMRHFDRLRPEMERRAKGAAPRPVSDVRLLSPIANPGKIIAAPVNYQRHLDELRADTGINFGNQVRTIDEYGLFLKAPGSLVGPHEGVVADWADRRIDHEIELAAVIGRQGFRIPRDQALAYVAGMLIYGIVRLVEYASMAYTLHPGDVILTRTPEGVAPAVPGDVMHAWIDRIGTMEVAVRGA